MEMQKNFFPEMQKNQVNVLVKLMFVFCNILMSKLCLQYINLVGVCDLVQELKKWAYKCNNLASACILDFWLKGLYSTPYFLRHIKKAATQTISKRIYKYYMLLSIGKL